MVKISPKALRFATAATMAALHGRSENHASTEAAWTTGATLWDDLVKRHPLADTDQDTGTLVKYISIPNEVGLLLLFAVDKCIAVAEHDRHDETDPDVGNDLMFLHSIRESLQLELQRI